MWRRVRHVVRAAPPATSAPCGGTLGGAVGAIRTKKWKPFHDMYRMNRLREIRAKEAEKRQADLLQASDAGAEVVAHTGPEPIVATTPFQATRLMRAFHVFPEEAPAVKLGVKVDVDLTRESVRGTLHLPHGLNTSTRVLAFCFDHEVEEMMNAGADIAGITEPVRRIQQGWLGFDRCLATPTIMKEVMKVAKVLGPKGLMPTPKGGTVVTNLKQAIQEAKSGTLLEFRARGEGEIMVTIADESFSDARILENMKFFVQTLVRARPRDASAVGKKAPGKGPDSSPLIPGAPATKESSNYFIDATLQLGTEGPRIRMDPHAILPASTGYFR